MAEVDDELAKYAVKSSSDDEDDELRKYAASQGGGAPADESDVEALPGSTPRLREQAKTFRPPTRTEKEAPQIPENYGLTPGHMLAAGARGLGNVIKFGGEVLGDVGNVATGQKPLLFGSSETEGPEESVAHKYVFRPQEQELEVAKQHEARAKQLPFLSREGLEEAAIGTGHRIASALPLIGPWVAGHSEQAGQGDVGGAIGEAGGEMAGGKLAEKVIRNPIKTAKTLGAVADKVVRGTPITKAGKSAAAVEQAMTVKKPTMTETEYAQRVTDAQPELQRIARDNPNIKTPRDEVGAINKRIAQIESPIRQHLQQVPDVQQMVPALDWRQAVEQGMDEALSQRGRGHFGPDEIERAKNTVRKFLGEQDKPAIELDGNRERLNDDANKYFTSSTEGKRSIDVSDATAVAQRAAGNAIRNVLYGDQATPGVLERIGITAADTEGNPMDLRQVRKNVGNLLEIRDHFEDAITRAETSGDWKAWAKLHVGPSLAAGGLGMLGGAIVGHPMLGALVGEGMKAWGDYLRSKNPNLNTVKMNRNLRALPEAPTVEISTQRPPVLGAARALPAPAVAATPMPGPIGVAGTPIEGGRWVTPKAALPPEQPITPTFIREILRAGEVQTGLGRAEAPLLPAPREMPETNIPPMTPPEFAREEVRPLGTVGERAPETQLGTMGRAGLRQRIRALLPDISGEGERAWLLVRQTLDMLESGEKPGRYYAQNEPGEYNLKPRASQGSTRGGQWYGVKSMRGMLPWFKDTEFTPEDLRSALKQFEKSGKVNPVMRSAMEFVKREGAKAEPTPGEEEVPF